MADETLTLDTVRTLYARFDPAAVGWQAWFDACLADVRWAQEASNEDLRSPEGQRRLWALKGVSTLGPGEHIDIAPILEDEELVDALCALRGRHWPSLVGKRAQDIQAAYDNLTERLGAHYQGNRPRAKLHRAMFALLPYELHVGFSWESHRTIRKLVVGQPQAKWLQAAVLTRERLRQALGPEEGLEDDIRRALFCWWLHEHAPTLLAGEMPGDGKDDLPIGTGTDDSGEVAVEPLILEPFAKQSRGTFGISGFVTAYRDVVQASMGGKTMDELVETVRTDLGYDQWSPKSTRMVIRRVASLGLLDRDGDRFLPSEEGEQFLEVDPPAVLIDAMFVRVYGFAQAVRVIDAAPRSVPQVAERLRAEYPGWKTNWNAKDRLKWAEALGLATRDSSGQFALTPYGREWAARLPETLPKPPPSALVDDDDDDEGDDQPLTTVVRTDRPHPGFGEIWDAFQQPPHSALLFSRGQVRALHAAWAFHPRKRFAILSGLSGTGKTEILLTYGQIVCEQMGLKPEKHVRRVAVGPDWRDPTGLLGYFNALHSEPTFQAEPALRIVLDAVSNPEVPYFLVLDEMNLARVERYFAPFLSAMESAKDPWIQLHAHDEAINGVPARVRWPANLRIGGTVNMDETTHPFSDKVLDRAFTLEFWEVNLKGFFERRPSRTALDEQIEPVLLEVQEVLTTVRRHFGYRSAGEVLDWVAAATASDGSASPADCLDQALFSKVLPRLRGAQTPALEAALTKLHALFQRRELPLCAAKVDAMQRRLLDTGVTGFWS